jgi:hypothetical protein
MTDKSRTELAAIWPPTADVASTVGHAPMSPLKAIRLKCLDCACYQPSEVRQCEARSGQDATPIGAWKKKPAGMWPISRKRLALWARTALPAGRTTAGTRVRGYRAKTLPAAGTAHANGAHKACPRSK